MPAFITFMVAGGVGRYRFMRAKKLKILAFFVAKNAENKKSIAKILEFFGPLSSIDIF